MKYILFHITLILNITLVSQVQNFDFKLATKHYSSEEYNAMPQIFDIAQDNKGIMYFANQNGVVEYDGSKWRNISLYPESEINALGTDNKGNIFAGGFEQFGYLLKLDSGKIKFQSLKDKIPDSVKFKRIVNILVNKSNTVLFQSQKHLFIYDQNEVKIVSAKGKNVFHEAFLLNDRFYVNIKNKGLYSLIGEELQLLNNGDFFSNDDIVSIDYFNDKTIVITDHKVYQMDKNSIEEIELKELNNIALYRTIGIGSKFLSVGTFGQGVFLYDEHYQLKYVIDQKSGLLDGVIQCQQIDREGNLWIGTNNGIIKVLINSPITLSNLKDNEISTIEEIIEFDNKLFFSSFDGIHYLEKDNFQKGFSILKGIYVDCYGFMTYKTNKEEYLLIAGVDNIYSLDKKGNLKNIADCSPYAMMVDYLDSSRIVVCNYKGLSSIKWNGEKFIDEGFVAGFEEDVYNFEYDNSGNLYIGSKKKGLFKTTYKIFNDHKEPIYNISGDFLEDKTSHAYVAKIDNSIYVGTNNGLYSLKEKKWKKTALGDSNHLEYGIHRIRQFYNGDVWMITYNNKNIFEYEAGYSRKENNKYTWHAEDFKNYADELIHATYVDKNQTVWLGGVKNIFRFDTEFEKSKKSEFYTLLRQINWGDEIIFSGEYDGINDSSLISQPYRSPLELNYSNKRLEFQFTATSLQNEFRNQFSHRLVGQDEKWSEWESEISCDYTNLHEGEYTFIVKSKNLFGKEGKPTEFKFIIHPPWYRTNFAYLGYILVVFLIIYLSIKLGTVRIKKQKKLLEDIVKERTKEISHQKNEIEVQREELQELYNDVTDSIKYAKRLQDSILPSNNFIKELFPESFVYFKPKDIVSGDFYWTYKLENEHLIAAIDCTGHGVPGAFMSLVGASGLNASVRDNKNTRPSMIMDDLNSFAHNALNKNQDHNINDGMDMTLIALNQKKKKLKFAGAYNPLYVVRDGEIIIHKTDRFAIGSFEPGQKKFTPNEISVKKNDMIYLFSDGFPDQFGGPRGKKFMSKNFRSLIVSIANKTVEQQKKQLDQTFMDWKGNLEQMDDILVIGVRVQ